MARMTCDVLIVGAGPAGLMAAVAASASGRRVRVCERMPAAGRKLLATGGGRCNLTHASPPDEMAAAFGRQGRVLRAALRAFPPDALRAWFAAAGVPTMVQDDGCVFPVSQKARDVLDALRQQAQRGGAEICCGCLVRRIVVREGAVAGVETATGPVEAGRVILAAGGCGYPALGSNGSGFDLAAAVGHTLVRPVPALVPLVTVEDWPRELAGIVLDPARVRCDATGRDRHAHVGPLLFTHRGVSGPPALDVSGAVAERLACAEGAAGTQAGGNAPRGVMLRVAWRADRDTAAWRALFDHWRETHGGRALHNLLAGELPVRLAQTLCRLAGAADVAAARARRAQLDQLAGWCGDAPLEIAGTEGWEQAMVTRGGVAWDEVNPRTLESRRASGLFFAGEVLDADGPCGGYNLTWAFASGRLAGTGSRTNAMV